MLVFYGINILNQTVRKPEWLQLPSAVHFWGGEELLENPVLVHEQVQVKIMTNVGEWAAAAVSMALRDGALPRLYDSGNSPVWIGPKGRWSVPMVDKPEVEGSNPS